MYHGTRQRNNQYFFSVGLKQITKAVAKWLTPTASTVEPQAVQCQWSETVFIDWHDSTPVVVQCCCQRGIRLAAALQSRRVGGRGVF